MKTVNNVTILDTGDINKAEYRAAARAALEAGGSVSIPSVGISIHMVNSTLAKIVDLTAGVDHNVVGKSAAAIVDTIAAYKTADRILAFLAA